MNDRIVKLARVGIVACLVAVGSTFPAHAADTTSFDEGVRLYTAGEDHDGILTMARAIAADPGNIVYQSYMLSLLDRQEHGWNVALLESVYNILPDSVPVLDRLGKLYEGQHRFADAERLYQTWAKLRPDQAEVYARLGELYLFTGHMEPSKKAFIRHRALVGESDYAIRRLEAIETAQRHPATPVRYADDGRNAPLTAAMGAVMP